VRYRLKGSRSQKLKALGSPAELRFGQAYERAKEVLREAERGVDWFEAIKRERAQTLGQVWRYYEQEHLATDAVAAASYVNAKVLWRLHCTSVFDTCSLADITSEKARDWHRRITKGGAYNANRAAQMLRAAWNYGRKYGRIPREFENPFAAVTLNKELARQTILEPHQFPAFSNAVNALADPYARAYIWSAFYTGCRRTELLKLTWSDVELLPSRKKEPRSGTLLLREVKGGEPRRVALSAPAVKVLEALPRTDNPYVFAGTVPGTHLDPKAHWELVRTGAKLPELRLHDLRRSFGSWLGAAGVTPKLIGAALGHKTDITSRVYVQLGEAANIKRQLVTAHAALAKEFAKKKPRAKVLELRARAQE
jgi:integrase